MNRRDYEKLKSWFDTFRERSLAERSQAESELPLREPSNLLQGFRRLYWESESRAREQLLSWTAELLGEKAALFFEEVVASNETRLGEKKLALDLLRRTGSSRADGFEPVERVWQFITVDFPAFTKGPSGGTWEEGWRRFRDLPASLCSLAAQELLERYPEEGISFIAFGLSREDVVLEQVLEAIALSPCDEAADLLSQAYQKARERSLQKRIKALAHKRRARGLSSSDFEQASSEGTAVWAPPAPPKPVGLFAISDPPESKLVWVIRHRMPKGMLVFGGLTHETRGLLNFFVLELSRRESEKYRESVLKNAELTAVEADPGFCAYLLEDCYRKGVPPDEQEALLYKNVRPLLKEMVPDEPPEAPIYTAFSASAEMGLRGDPLGETAGLLQHPKLQSYQMDPLRLRPHLEKLQEIAASRIIVHPLQKRERTEAHFRQATRELLSEPEYRNLWRRRIEDVAWVLHCKGSGTEARRLLEIARFLKDPAQDAARLTFFTQLVRKSLEDMMQRQKVEERATPSLIVKP